MKAPPDPIRVVMAKPGLDSHFRGLMTVSRYLASQGMEVVYLGNQTPEAIVRSTIEEHADVLGISSLSGNHLTTIPPITQGLRLQGAADIVIVVGGIVPAPDAEVLHRACVHHVFTPGSRLEDVSENLRAEVTTRRTR